MSTFTPAVTQVPYGAHIPYDKGYDYTSQKPYQSADALGSSSFLTNPSGDQIGLWVTNITADFSLSGETGQSQMLREFYPRSFNDVTLVISGNVASSYEYNRLALFVREHHWNALNNIRNGLNSVQTISFTLGNTYGSGNRQIPAPAPRGPDATGTNTGVYANTKGPHRPWSVTGYIQSISAGAVAQEVAPEFQLAFIVATSDLTPSTGIWSDTPDPTGSALKSMLEILDLTSSADRAPGTGFITDPILAPSSPAATKVVSAVVGASEGLYGIGVSVANATGLLTGVGGIVSGAVTGIGRAL